jgi:hypothetical protein
MNERPVRQASFEGQRLAVLLAGGAVWAAYLGWIAPLLYEMLCRQCLQDYAYLWNGFPDKVRGTYWMGPAVLLVFYASYLLMKGFDWLSGLLREKRGRQAAAELPLEGGGEEQGPARCARKILKALARESVILLSIAIFSAAVLYFSRSDYLSLKQRYFEEYVTGQESFRVLSAREKKKAQEQYEKMAPEQAVQGLLDDYGWRARAVFYAQHVSLLIFVWGYPSVFILRTLWWFRRMKAARCPG